MFGSDTSIKLQYDDIEELQQHPLASNLLIEFHALVSQLSGHDKEYFENWKEEVDLSSIDPAKLKAYEERGTYYKRQVDNVRLWENALGLMEGFSQTTSVEASILL